MNRHYGREKYLSLTRELKEKVPGISLTTDVIVGFPGETDADFEDTLSILEAVRFDGVFSFIYSPRKGTPAASYPDRVPDEVCRARMARLLDAQLRIQTENNERYVGQTLVALCEGPSKNDPAFLSARSGEGRLIHFPAGGAAREGEFVKVKITSARAIMLIGEEVQ